MLRELHIRNFALLEDARLALREGFNCLTGETGVGKSLVLGALDLLLGGRPRPEMVRKGADDLHVQGMFEIDSPRMHCELSEAMGFPLEDDVAEMLLEREYAANGRNRCRVNGRPVGVGVLRAVGERLVDIHGQHEHESLLQPANQRAVLDSYAGLDEDRERYRAAYESVRALRARHRELQDGEDLRRQRAELTGFQLDEARELAAGPGEHEALVRERDLLANGERLREGLARAAECLYERDESAAAAIQRSAQELRPLAADPELQRAVAALEEASTQVEEAVFALRRFAEGFEFDPARLEQIEERLAQFERIAHRHRTEPGRVHDLAAQLEAELARLQGESRDLSEMEARIAQAEQDLLTQGRDLTRRRAAAGGKLATHVQKEMRDLAMAAGRFRVDVTSVAEEGEVLSYAGPTGLDTVEFMIGTNPGEDLHPLRLVGSGGEVARIMLAIKGCLAEVDRTPVFVFDEIDANVGGRTGAVIGEKLGAIARRHQVVCITHLPQIAAYADIQVKVRKTVRDGRTVTDVVELSPEQRIEELAEMIHGDRRTETTRRQAQEMLDSARRPRPPRERRAARAKP